MATRVNLGKRHLAGNMYTEELLTLCSLLKVDRGVPDDQLREVETRDRYTLDISPSRADLLALTAAHCQSLLDTFQSAMTLRIGNSTVPTLELSRGQIPADLDQQLERVKTYSTTLALSLTIEKQPLVERLLPARKDVTGHFFFFTPRLLSVLRRPLQRIEEELFPADKPSVVVLGDADIFYTGQILNIVGEKRLTPEMAFSPLSPSLQTRLDDYRQIAAEELSWVGFSLSRITPLHFIYTPHGTRDTAVSNVLDLILLHLSVLYSANRTSMNDNTYSATYSSSERTVTLPLRQDDRPPARRYLTLFALWFYESSGGSDRLTILQTVIARELTSLQEVASMNDFTTQLAHLLSEARWNYRTFIEKQIDQYFVQLRGARDYVAETLKKVADAVDTVTKGLTEVLLAAIGVLIAALLAALAKPQEEGRIVSTIMGLYAAYLVVQAILRLGSVLHSTILLRNETNARLRALTPALGTSNIEKVAQPLKPRWRQFYIWLGISTLLFLGLAIGSLTWTPSFVKSTIPTSTATPTVTVSPKP